MSSMQWWRKSKNKQAPRKRWKRAEEGGRQPCQTDEEEERGRATE
jgi:hypothetical protein